MLFRMEQASRLLTYSDLADRWGCRRRSLIQLYSQAPQRLPPAVRLPGVRGPRWRLAEVEAWESGHLQPATAISPGRPRGRPRIVARSQ